MNGVLFWVSVGVILYTYLGYPALLALLPKKRKSPGLVQNYEPSVTLLIAAYNEEACIARKLENALGLDYPKNKLQILVAADGSDDRTADIVLSFAERGVELSYQPRREGKMAAINRAMHAAAGDIVVFSDANNMYETGTLRALVEPFQDDRVGGVSGAKHIVKNEGGLSGSEGLYWKYESYIKKQETALGSCSGVSGEIFAIRRNLFETAPRGIVNDDFYMAMRLLRQGYRVVYSPQARSYESVSLTADDEIVRRTRINAGRYQALWMSRKILPVQRPLLLWQIFSHKFLRLAIPFAMIGAFLANFIALFNTGGHSLFKLSPPYNWIFFVLQLLFYLFAFIGSKINIRGKPGKVLYLATFLLNSNFAALKGFFHFLKRQNNALWVRVRRADEGGELNRS